MDLHRVRRIKSTHETVNSCTCQLRESLHTFHECHLLALRTTKYFKVVHLLLCLQFCPLFHTCRNLFLRSAWILQVRRTFDDSALDVRETSTRNRALKRLI